MFVVVVVVVGSVVCKIHDYNKIQNNSGNGVRECAVYLFK